jgi:hypothetical protein
MGRLDVERPINHRDIPRRMTAQDRANTISGCATSYDLRLLWNPTAATMSIDVKLNGVTETISIGLTDDETDVKTAIDAHSEFVADGVHCTTSSAGGFPSSNILVTLPSGATITDHAATLTQRSGSPTPEFRVDICGCAA